MITPTVILIALILIGVSLIALLVLHPSVTATRVGKALAFISFFIIPLLAAFMGSSEHIERSKTTNFCLSCHVMTDYGKSLRVDDSDSIPAVHFQNHLVPSDHACYTCHTDYTLYGDVHSKLRGLRHVYVNYLGTIPKTIKLYNPYNNRECLHCHNGARSFESGETHNEVPGRILAIKSNRLSCVSSGCHEVVHDVRNLNRAKLWKEPMR